MKRLWYWLKRLKSDIFLLYLAFKDPRVPRQAKILLMLLAAYIISPIDILPDFVIPGLGYIDDLALISYVAGFIKNDSRGRSLRSKFKGHASRARGKELGSCCFSAGRPLSAVAWLQVSRSQPLLNSRGLRFVQSKARIKRCSLLFSPDINKTRVLVSAGYWGLGG